MASSLKKQEAGLSASLMVSSTSSRLSGLVRLHSDFSSRGAVELMVGNRAEVLVDGLPESTQ